jgi:glycosyltransferase involved in cell wall biosynthesis
LSGRTDIHFVLVGGGDLRETYVARLSAQANVSFIPKIARNEVQSFLQRCDILYLSTHDSPVWRFGQSLNKMIDYMLAGKPIIASYSGYPSMINEARAGVFVKAGDQEALTKAIIRMAEMPAESRAEMGARGRAWLLANRSYAVLGKEYLSALKQVVRGGA